MAILASIGNAFKTGWERSGSKRNAIDEYSGNYKYTNIYKNNINFSSFLLPDHVDRNALSSKTDFSTTAPLYKQGDFYYENDFKVPVSILKEVTKNYKFVYDKEANIVTDYGVKEEDKDKDQDISYEVISMPVVPSMFNPLYGINIVGINGNTPLMNNDKDKITSGQFSVDYGADYSQDLSDCSIATLVKLSNEGKMGRAMYKYADFMYCKNLGKIANNRLITLRRFPTPIGDNIWDLADYGDNGEWIKGSGPAGGVQIPYDTGRLITWLDENNKVEDILKYEYHETWTEKQAHFQEMDSKADQDNRGILGSIVNLANPVYRKSVGTGISGAGNKVLEKFAGAIPILSHSGTMSHNAEGTLNMYDVNRVYEPEGTIRKTTLYNGELEFTHSFTLTFDYELRAYENINPRTAFLDLMNNIQQVTYRSGKFWGGQVWWIGAPENRKGWQTAEALMNHSFEKIDDTFKMLLSGDLNIGDLLGSLANGAGKLLKSAVNEATSFVTSPEKRKDVGEKAIQKAQDLNINSMLRGMLKNKLGRPAVYAMHSILNGSPTGLWHVTIGNPRNPILSMGNMIIENTSFSQYGPLGIDDFPTGIKVAITLKHAKPRDMIEIGKMYTMGRTGLGVPLGRTYITDMIKKSDNKMVTSWASTVHSITDGKIPPANSN